MAYDEASEEGEFLSALMLLLRGLFTKLSKMNKYNAFIELYAMGDMFWPCYRQERYISVKGAKSHYFRQFQH